MLAVSSVFYRLLREIMFPWCKEAVPDTQFGFYQGRCTMHLVFTLKHLAHARAQARSLRKLYTAFIDFTQAYDHVPRSHLWHHLEHTLGFPPTLLKAIKSLYDDDHYFVVDGWARSECISPNKGVKQGCPLSPLLFALFLSDIGTCFHGIDTGLSVTQGGFRRSISHLLYADCDGRALRPVTWL